MSESEAESGCEIRTRGLSHIHLLVGSIARSRRFYEEVFGLRERFWDGPSLLFLGTPGRDDLVTLREVGADDPRVGQAPGLGHFGFRLVDPSQVDRAIELVLANEGTLIERGERGPGDLYAYVRDPDGYPIEL